MRTNKRKPSAGLACSALLMLAVACSSSSSDGGGSIDATGDTVDGGSDVAGDTAGEDGGSDAAGDTVGGDTGPAADSGGDVSDEAAQLIGSYDLESITREDTTLTTENQDMGGGVMGRVEGSLLVEASGRYTVELTIFVDDAPAETVNESGNWSLPEAGRIRLEADDDEPFEADYTYDSGSDRLTIVFADETGRGTYVLVKTS